MLVKLILSGVYLVIGGVFAWVYLIKPLIALEKFDRAANKRLRIFRMRAEAFRKVVDLYWLQPKETSYLSSLEGK